MKKKNKLLETPPEEKNGFWRFMLLLFAEFFNLVLANLLFLVTALGIVTIPACTAGLAKVTMNMADGRGEGVAEAYFSVFRKKFLRCLGCGALTGAATFLTGASCVLYATLGHEQSSFFYFVAGIGVLLVIGVQMVSICLFPLLALTDLSFKPLLLETKRVLFARPLPCLAAALINLGIAAISVLLNPGSIIFIIFIEFSFMSFIASFFMYPGLREYFPRGK